MKHIAYAIAALGLAAFAHTADAKTGKEPVKDPRQLETPTDTKPLPSRPGDSGIVVHEERDSV